MGKFIMIV